MRTRIAIGMAALLGAAFAPAPLPKADRKGPKQELKSLEGTWALVSMALGGKERGKALDMKLVIADGKWAFVRNGTKNIEYDMAVDTKGKVPTLDLHRAGAQAPTIRVVYVRKGDTLKLCYFGRTKGGGEVARPSGPDDPNPRMMTMTWQREKK